MSSTCSAASADSVSASSEPECEPSRSAKSTPTPEPFCESTGPTFPNTTMSAPLRQIDWLPMESPLMSSAAASPARTSALQAEGRALPGSGRDSGANTPAWLASYAPDSSSWKTSQHCLLEGLATFSETWPRSGMTRNGTAYQLPTLALATSGIESGSLPTLTLCGNYNRKGASKKSGDGIITALNQMLPTLTARDYKSDSCGPEYRQARDAMTMGKTLPWTLGGLLNPRWCEGFMGYPIGWTELDASETP
jgi:hypothetical protein